MLDNPNENLNLGRDKRLKKKRVFKKTSVIVFLLMTVFVMTPVLAFASVGFKDVNYRGQKVRGIVYAGQNADTSKGVSVDVYAPDGHMLTTAYAHKARSVEDMVYYDFSAKIGKFPYVKLYENITNTVYDTVYRFPDNSHHGPKSRGEHYEHEQEHEHEHHERGDKSLD